MYPKITLIAAVLLAVTMSAQSADDIMKWDKSPEAYYMTTEERAQWSKIASPEDARQFVDQYFRKRGERFGKDVRTRIDIADKQFKLDKTAGSRTAKGRVFMILGSPNRSTTNRDVAETREGGAIMGGNVLENKALMGTQWIYEKDRLPVELGLTQLKVNFVYDARRGVESIENLGNVEPHLLKAAELISNSYIAAAQAAQTQAGAPPVAPAPAGPDPLWNATPALNGAIFTGESYVSPREEPFYAYSFFVPTTAGGFGDAKSVLSVALVRDASGNQVLAQREPVNVSAYDDAGNRYVDGSVALPAGKYDGLFALYTPEGATLLSSQRTSFEIAPKEAQRASALLLTGRIDVLETQKPFDPFTFVATKYAVRGDRRFKATDKLGFFTVVSNPAGSPTPNLMQKMVFKRDGKDFAKTPLEPAQVTQTGPNTFLVGMAFDPDTFPAGHYSIELQVRDMNAPEGSDLRTKGYVLTNEFDVVK